MSARAKDLNHDLTAEVLYQRLGDCWYAFSVVGGEIYFGRVPSSVYEGFEEGEEIHGVGTIQGKKRASGKIQVRQSRLPRDKVA